MYLQDVSDVPFTTTLIKIKYDCCGKEHVLKWKDAKANYEKNQGKHICRSCGLKINNPARSEKVKEKIKKTNLERYGATIALNTKENIAARVEKMFGTEEATAAIVEKRKTTSQQRYGAEHIMKTQEGIKRLKEAMQERYGVDFPLQSEEIKQKMRETCQERYGVDNPAQLPEVQIKMAKTTLEKYGVEHYNQLPEMKDYLRENCRDWLKEAWANPWAKGIIRPEDWNQKQRETVMELMNKNEWKSGPKYSIKGHYQSQKCKRLNSMFRSSYELKTHWHLDNDPEVEWYDYEPFRVSYYDVGQHKRYYIIDFIVKYKNIERLLAIEVKNDYSEKLELVLLKKNAFEEECGEMIDYEIWSNEKIKSLNLELDELLESSLVTII